MEIVSRPDLRSPEDAAAYVKTLRALVRRLGHLRRRHGEGQPSRRRQCVGAEGRRRRSARAARSRTSTPCASSSRPSSMRLRRQVEVLEDGGSHRHRRRGSTIAGQGRDALHAVEGGGARLPLLPRPRPAAAGAGPRLGQGHRGHPAGTAGCSAGEAAEPVRPVTLRRAGAGRRPAAGGLLRDRRNRPRRQAWWPTGSATTWSGGSARKGRGSRTVRSRPRPSPNWWP